MSMYFRCSHVNLTNIKDETDVNIMWTEMYIMYLIVLDRMCPIVEYVNVKCKQNWITPHLFELMKKRDYCYKIAHRTGDNADWIAAKK